MPQPATNPETARQFSLGALLRDQLAKQAARAFVWFVAAFAAGAALFFAWRNDPSLWVTAGVLASGVGLFALRGRVYGARFAALVVIFMGLGHGAAAWRTARVATPLLENESRPFMLTATVVDAERRPDGNRLVLSDFELPNVTTEATPERLRITVPASHGVPAVGERIRVRVVVRPAALPVMPDGFQFQRFPYARGKREIGSNS